MAQGQAGSVAGGACRAQLSFLTPTCNHRDLRYHQPSITCSDGPRRSRHGLAIDAESSVACCGVDTDSAKPRPTHSTAYPYVSRHILVDILDDEWPARAGLCASGGQEYEDPRLLLVRHVGRLAAPPV